jgi:hypothetical protein
MHIKRKARHRRGSLPYATTVSANYKCTAAAVPRQYCSDSRAAVPCRPARQPAVPMRSCQCRDDDGRLGYRHCRLGQKPELNPELRAPLRPAAVVCRGSVPTATALALPAGLARARQCRRLGCHWQCHWHGTWHGIRGAAATENVVLSSTVLHLL